MTDAFDLIRNEERYVFVASLTIFKILNLELEISHKVVRVISK